MNADGSDKKNLTNSPDKNDTWPDWETISIIGGELIPVDNVSLVLAYSLVNSWWMAPIGIGIGVGIYLVKRRF